MIRRGLTVDVPRRSNILDIRFRHPDANIAHDVLTNLVKVYLDQHVKLHQDTGTLERFFHPAERPTQVGFIPDRGRPQETES